MTAYKLDNALFQALLRNHSQIKRHFEIEKENRERRNFLRLYTAFSGLPLAALRRLGIEGESVDIPAGETVIAQGEVAPAMFIIEEGKARAAVKENGRQFNVAFLRQGEYFGLESMPANKPQRASVIAVSPCRLLKIPAATFSALYNVHKEFREEIDQRAATRDYREVSRVPLDFAEEMPSANPVRSQQAGVVEFDDGEAVSHHGPHLSSRQLSC